MDDKEIKRQRKLAPLLKKWAEWEKEIKRNKHKAKIDPDYKELRKAVVPVKERIKKSKEGLELKQEEELLELLTPEEQEALFPDRSTVEEVRPIKEVIMRNIKKFTTKGK